MSGEGKKSLISSTHGSNCCLSVDSVCAPWQALLCKHTSVLCPPFYIGSYLTESRIDCPCLARRGDKRTARCHKPHILYRWLDSGRGAWRSGDRRTVWKSDTSGRTAACERPNARTLLPLPPTDGRTDGRRGFMFTKLPQCHQVGTVKHTREKHR